jgi:hypothetical protein
MSKDIFDVTKLDKDQLHDLIEMMESPVFVQLFKPILESRQEALINSLITKDDDQVRGRIKEIASIISIHDAAFKILKAGEAEEKTVTKDETSA